MPPTTPPIRAALLDDFEPPLVGVADSVPVVEAAPALLVWSAVVGDVDDVDVVDVVWAISELVDEVVLVLLVVAVGALDVVVNAECCAASSGQIPDVQGSLEQHPSNPPAEQTYHS